MLDWIQDNKDEFLCHFTEIGEDLEYAVELREEHKQFEENCGVRIFLSVFFPPLIIYRISCVLEYFSHRLTTCFIFCTVDGV